jgi:hypothetical protein
MKRWVILILGLLLIPMVSATLSVTLNSPNDGNITSSSTVTFNCSVSDNTYNISTVQLFTNNSNTWAQVGSNVTGDVDTASFEVTGLSDGSYLWNCLVTNNNSNTAFASANRTVVVETDGYLSVIPNQTWREDTSLDEAFDLDTYFSGASSYTVSGNSSISITIDSNNVVSFSSIANYTGYELVTFTADTGSVSGEIELNVTNVDDPPNLYDPISDQTGEKNNNITLTMSNYFQDLDGNDVHNYSLIGSYFTSIYDDKKDYLYIYPTINWTGSEDLFIVASDSNYSVNSNTFTITIGDDDSSKEEIELTSQSPDSDPEITVGESVDFSIDFETEDGQEYSIIWYVNGEVQEGETDKEFSYTPESEGTYTVKAEISTESSSTSYSWTLTVKAELESESVESTDIDAAICGNGIQEEGENCSTCPDDAGCSGNASCEAGICVEKSSGSRAIAIFLISFVMLLLIGILIYYFTTLKNSGNQPPQQAVAGNPRRFVPRQAPPSDVGDFYQRRNTK